MVSNVNESIKKLGWRSGSAREVKSIRQVHLAQQEMGRIDKIGGYVERLG